jgi:ElaB/YqjD/DUF883 family membrane-anchored ribosome-binding protein
MAEKTGSKAPSETDKLAATASSAAEEAVDPVEKARLELEKAREFYQKVRREATERLKAVREKTVGDLIEDTLEMVKKHPGPGVVIAGMLGFFAGRFFTKLFRR